MLFCHVIESSSPEDMDRLRAFVESLVPACPLSEQVERLHRLCHVLYTVATLYVEAKSQQQFDQSFVPISNEFDMYLSALGLIPIGSQDTDAAQGQQVGGLMSNLGEWFSGNRQMMDLLERDMPQFDGTEWM